MDVRRSRDSETPTHRYPGDGIAPITMILQTLKANGATTALSLELFNKKYWEQDAAEVLRTGIAKMRAAVEKAGA